MRSLLVLCVLVGPLACSDNDATDPNSTDTSDPGGSDSSTDPPTPAVPTYDFAAAAPWYACPTAEPPEGVTVVTAFDRIAQHFTGEEDRRTVEADVDFPAASEWAQVGVRFHLECPEDGQCDHWDRAGSVQLVRNPQDDPSTWEQLEILRHITPYRREMCQYIDVTPMASLLVGAQKLTSFIDTWVGPGHAEGHGWRVSLEFVFYPGESAAADEVLPVWGRRSLTVGQVEPDANVDSQIEPVTVAIPADATRVEAHLTTTGHSFGNTGNCAEFCELRQDVIVNGALHSVVPWRSDCEENPVADQPGTWEYDRNGWCPGAVVVGHRLDITDALVPGQDNLLDFDIRLESGNEYYNVNPVELLPYELVALQLYVYK